MTKAQLKLQSFTNLHVAKWSEAIAREHIYTTTYSSIATDCSVVPAAHLLQQDTLELQLE